MVVRDKFRVSNYDTFLTGTQTMKYVRCGVFELQRTNTRNTGTYIQTDIYVLHKYSIDTEPNKSLRLATSDRSLGSEGIDGRRRDLNCLTRNKITVTVNIDALCNLNRVMRITCHSRQIGH